MEKRRRTRVSFKGRVDIKTDASLLVDLPARDLSHKGIFLLGELPLELKDKCVVILHLPGAPEESTGLRLQGEVARITDEGVAVDFESMDADAYMHLRNLVLLNADDPKKAEEEFSHPAFEDKAD